MTRYELYIYECETNRSFFINIKTRLDAVLGRVSAYDGDELGSDTRAIMAVQAIVKTLVGPIQILAQDAEAMIQLGYSAVLEGASIFPGLTLPLYLGENNEPAQTASARKLLDIVVALENLSEAGRLEENAFETLGGVRLQAVAVKGELEEHHTAVAERYVQYYNWYQLNAPEYEASRDELRSQASWFGRRFKDGVITSPERVWDQLVARTLGLHTQESAKGKDDLAALLDGAQGRGAYDRADIQDDGESFLRR